MKNSQEKTFTLVVGATGATGRLLVEQLLNRGEYVKVIVRSPGKLPDRLKNSDHLHIIHANIVDLTDFELAQHIQGCSAVASCLGHNISFKGLFGSPRRLVTDSVHRLCKAIKINKPETPAKFVLMNTAGCRNHDLNETVSMSQQCIIGLIRLLLPPHADNEQAAEYLRTTISHNDDMIEWAAVRPDSLINEDAVSEYEVHPSPTQSAIFDPGKTSRINVAHFMADLILNETEWDKWKFQMPVIYNTNY